MSYKIPFYVSTAIAAAAVGFLAWQANEMLKSFDRMWGY